MANGSRLDQVGRYAGILSVPVLAAGLYLGLFVAPPDAMMGDVQRIMYVHLPSWINGDLADLYNQYLEPDWRERWSDSAVWAQIADIPDEDDVVFVLDVAIHQR